MQAGIATEEQANTMVDTWLMNASRFCVSPKGDFAGNSPGCWWGLPSISADDPSYPASGYWRGHVWGPMLQLTYALPYPFFLQRVRARARMCVCAYVSVRAYVRMCVKPEGVAGVSWLNVAKPFGLAWLGCITAKCRLSPQAGIVLSRCSVQSSVSIFTHADVRTFLITTSHTLIPGTGDLQHQSTWTCLQ